MVIQYQRCNVIKHKKGVTEKQRSFETKNPKPYIREKMEDVNTR